MSQIWSLVLISLDEWSVGFLPWWAGRLRQRLFSRTSWVIRCWFPCRFKADLTEARGAITACLEDLWHIQVNAKGAYCCRIMSLSETDRTSKTVSDMKQRSPLLILTHQWGRCWIALKAANTRIRQCRNTVSVALLRRCRNVAPSWWYLSWAISNRQKQLLADAVPGHCAVAT